MQIFGNVDNYRLVSFGKELHLGDEALFNSRKECIRSGSHVFVLPRLSGGCFTSDTIVLLCDGTTKIISEVQVGDSLLAFTAFGDITTTCVQAVFIHDVDDYIELHAEQTVLHVTREHPFFIGNGIFCPLEKFRINDCIYKLVGNNLQSISIVSMKTVVAPMTRVYNLHTSDPHTYFANGVAVHNKYGVNFVDLNNITGPKRIQWSETAPKWRMATHGLCLEGRCPTSSCEAYKEKVVINIGYGKFDLLADVVDKSKCPICSCYVEPDTCAFNNCKWRWQGIKQPQTAMQPEKISTDWRIADDAYHLFDQDVSGTVTWRQLIIETEENQGCQIS